MSARHRIREAAPRSRFTIDDPIPPTSTASIAVGSRPSRRSGLLVAAVLCLASFGGHAATVTFTPDRSSFANPERGWYHSFNPVGDDPAGPLDEDFLRSLREGPDRVTLVRKYYLLKPWRDEPLPASVLEELEQDFETGRRAGVKLVPRFVYHWLEEPDVASDASLEITLGHLDQIGPVLRRNADALAWVQAGLVGKWGEWHSSTSGHVDNVTLALRASGLAIRDKLLEVVPESRDVAMRYVFWHKMKDYPEPLNADTARSGTPRARLGIYNDNMVNFPLWESDGDSPNYPPRQKLNDYMRRDSRWVVQEGEPQSWHPSDHYADNDPLPVLQALNFTAVNRNADTAVNDAWKRGGYWSALTRDLGYRLHLTEARLPDSVERGERLSVGLELRNGGYAAPINVRPLRLVLVDERDGTRFDLAPGRAPDPRRWQRGEHSVEADFALPADLPPGRYRAHLWLPDASTSLRADPAYGIRLASLRGGASIHDERTGLNDLFVSVQVTATGGEVDPPTEATWRDVPLSNAGFERGDASDWTLWNAPGFDAAAGVDDVNARLGRHKMYFWSAEGRVNQSAHLSAGDLPAGRYRAALWVRVRDEPGRCDVELRGGGANLATAPCIADGRWRRHVVDADAPAGEVELGLYVRGGSADLDGARLQRLE